MAGVGRAGVRVGGICGRNCSRLHTAVQKQTQGGFLVTTLPPHFASYRKRIRTRPRLHVLDTGLACYLLGVRDATTPERHPLRGSVFESPVVAELVKHFTAFRRDALLYHWRDATGHEIDVLIDSGDRLIPVEAKSGSTIPATACDAINWWTSLPGNPNRGGEFPTEAPRESGVGPHAGRLRPRPAPP